MRASAVRLFAGTIVLLLLAIVAVQMFVVVPAYRRLFDGIGVEPSLPARLAVAASRGGLVLFAVALAAIVAAFARERRSGGDALLVTLGVVSLGAALYLGIATCVYQDVVQVMDRVR